MYDESMTRIYLADAQLEERSALRLLLLDLKMEVVGEAADWPTTLAQAPVSRADLLLVDWEMLPNSATAALKKLRQACPAALVIVLISHLDARHKRQSPHFEGIWMNCKMEKRKQISLEEAKRIGESLNIDWDQVDLEQFRLGLMGKQTQEITDSETGFTFDGVLQTGQAVLAHMEEIPDYFNRLEKLKEEVDEYRARSR